MTITPRVRSLGFALFGGLFGLSLVLRFFLYAPLGAPGPDIDQVWWMGREIVRGHNPYAADQALHLFVTRIYYPLTSGVIVLPLVPLGLVPMRLVFVVGSGALLGYAIGQTRPYLWPTLFGLPFFIALRSAQWTPLLTAAMLWPALGWLAAAKPNIGLAMLAACRSRRDALILVTGGLAVALVSLAIFPRWPVEWLAALRNSVHFRPLIYRPAGFLVLLAALRWRDPDARLLLVLGLVPITGLMYDVLPAYVVCRTRAQAAVLALLSYAPSALPDLVGPAHGLADLTWKTGELSLWFVLLPATALVLSRSLPEHRFLRAGRPPAAG